MSHGTFRDIRTAARPSSRRSTNPAENFIAPTQRASDVSQPNEDVANLALTLSRFAACSTTERRRSEDRRQTCQPDKDPNKTLWTTLRTQCYARRAPDSQMIFLCSINQRMNIHRQLAVSIGLHLHLKRSSRSCRDSLATLNCVTQTRIVRSDCATTTNSGHPCYVMF